MNQKKKVEEGKQERKQKIIKGEKQ